MSFLRRFPMLAYTLVFLSLLAFNYAAENYGLMALSLTAVVVSWWLVETRDALVVPRWLINLGVLVVAMGLFWELVIYQQTNLLLALGHFMVGLIICKLFEKKANRDYGQILLLSLLLILSGAILTVSPIYAMILLMYLGLGLYTSLVFHLQCETQRAMQRHAAGDRMMIMPGQQTVMARDVRRISVGAGIFLFVFACAVFVLFPRTGMPGILASWRIGGTTATGLTGHIQLGRFGQLQQSNAIVAEVRITQDGQNIGSRGYQPYFMSTTQNFYDATTHEWLHARRPRWWNASRGPTPPGAFPNGPFFDRRMRNGPIAPGYNKSGNRVALPQPGQFGPMRLNQRGQRALRAERLRDWQKLRRERFSRISRYPKSIVLKRSAFTPLVSRTDYVNSGLITQKFTFTNTFRSGPLLAICPAVTISSPDLDAVTALRDGTIIADTFGHNLTYTVQSADKYNSSLIGPEKPSLFPMRFQQSMFGFYPRPMELRSAPIPRRVAALARKIAGPLLKVKRTGANAEKMDMLLASKFCNYLRQNYPYSFDMTPVNPNIDPTEDFLFNKKKIGAYCEYFASAMVMFCRSVQIPARMVSGFHGGDYNPVGGYYVIRAKFAHAWVQAWIPHRGWVMFDPSPISSLTGVQDKTTWFTEVADFFQWLRLKWLHNIITFNQTMRKAILAKIMTFAKAVMQTITYYAKEIGQHVRHFLNGLAMDVWMTIVMVIAAAGFFPLIIVIYSRWKRRESVATKAVRTMDRKVQKRMLRELMFIDRLMKLLSRTGVAREADQTPREYVQTVGQTTGLDLAAALRVVNAFYDIRFGSNHMSPQLAGIIKADMATVEQKIRDSRRK
jgi:transglutaminase-like putative cysteine protease